MKKRKLTIGTTAKDSAVSPASLALTSWTSVSIVIFTSSLCSQSLSL